MKTILTAPRVARGTAGDAVVNNNININKISINNFYNRPDASAELYLAHRAPGERAKTDPSAEAEPKKGGEAEPRKYA